MFENFRKSMHLRSYERGIHAWAKAGKFSVQGEPTTQVSTPTAHIGFFSEDRAKEWGRHNQCSQIHTFDHGHIEPQTMRWLIEHNKRGVNTGLLHELIRQSSIENFDDMVAWFVREPNPAAAMALIKLSFAANRPEATGAIAQWAKHNPSDWFNPATLLVSKDSKDDSVQGTRNTCLFGRLIVQADMMAWLFQHQLHMKHAMLDPHHWNPLQEKLRTLDPMQVAYWPAAAHKAFHLDVDPLQEHWPMASFGFACRTMPAYAHDTAAQSYILHQFVDTPVTDLLVEHARPEIIEVHHRIQLAIDPNHTRPARTPAYNEDQVEALMIGVHLGLDHRDFYYLAKSIFGPTHAVRPTVTYNDLDTSLF